MKDMKDMKIVVLDGYTLNPGDLTWKGLEALGTLGVHDRTEASLVVQRAQGADVLLTNKTPLPAEVLEQLKGLRYIGVLATGYNVVDVKAARALGIPVSNIPTYGTASVAQFAVALLLELCHHVGLHSDAVRAGDWSRSRTGASGAHRSSSLPARPWASSASDGSAARWARSLMPWECA